MENNTKIQMYGAPVNTKSLLAFVFNQMQQLSSGTITAQEACAQAKLASQACNILNYELKRTIVQIRLQQLGAITEVTDVQLRNVESKAFDDTTKK